MRNLTAHHYFDVEEDITFLVCKKELPKVLNVIRTIKNSLEA